MNLNEMTIAELTAIENELTGKSVKKSKGSKAAIIARIEKLSPPKKSRKRGPSTKDVIRGLYREADAAYSLEELAKICKTVKVNTVETAIVDLKNPKWSVGPTLVLTKGEDGKYRRA